jgi:hypothetical protein
MQICDKAKGVVKASNRTQLEALGKLLELCESPVEQILLAALFDRWGGYPHPKMKRLQCHFGADYPTYDGIFTACCEPQRNITTWSGDKYRVDFYVYLTRFGTVGSTQENHYSPELVRLVVEVDGHEFHEKTKDQASRDRDRDRKLMLAGCPVIRFTGSDVFNDPEGCAEQIDDQLNEYASILVENYLSEGKLEELICGARHDKP